MKDRPVILVICDYYLPGFESGGAMRTIVNMVDRMSDEFDFRIATRDHDGPLNLRSYDSVRIGEWNSVENARVYYMPKGNTGPGAIRTIIETVRPDALYVNSFFSPLTVAVLYLRRRGQIGVPVVLAPEGEFSPGALSLKNLKKTLYIRGAKAFSLLDDITWKAASESEASDVQAALGPVHYHIAPNLPPVPRSTGVTSSENVQKEPGRARMVFLSRYMRKKNLNWLLEDLKGVEGELTIDICGPIEEEDYWQEALRLIASLPPNIRVRALGPVAHELVVPTLAGYHFFVLPTLGENFGHVFVEAFEAGCPVITSDRTPWRDLALKGVGWDLSLNDRAKWIDVLNTCIAMDGATFSAMSRRAKDFAANWLGAPELEESNREVLRASLAKGHL